MSTTTTLQARIAQLETELQLVKDELAANGHGFHVGRFVYCKGIINKISRQDSTAYVDFHNVDLAWVPFNLMTPELPASSPAPATGPFRVGEKVYLEATIAEMDESPMPILIKWDEKNRAVAKHWLGATAPLYRAIPATRTPPTLTPGSEVLVKATVITGIAPNNVTKINVNGLLQWVDDSLIVANAD